MARFSVADSNRLFAELTDWNDILKHIWVDHLEEVDAQDTNAEEATKVVMYDQAQKDIRTKAR